MKGGVVIIVIVNILSWILIGCIVMFFVGLVFNLFVSVLIDITDIYDYVKSFFADKKAEMKINEIEKEEKYDFFREVFHINS